MAQPDGSSSSSAPAARLPRTPNGSYEVAGSGLPASLPTAALDPDRGGAETSDLAEKQQTPHDTSEGGGSSRTLASMTDLNQEDIDQILTALRTLLNFGLFGIPSLPKLMELLEQRLSSSKPSTTKASPPSALPAIPGPALEQRCASMAAVPVRILPDLVQVHLTLSHLANRWVTLPTQDDCTVPPGEDKQKCLLYLVPVWDWCERDPTAAHFWKAAHAVARDHNGDDWIAPHMTLHSRSGSVRGLAGKFCKLLSDIPASDWSELLSTLRDPSNWVFDEDQTPSKKPSIEHHFVLHKAHITLPKRLRSWLHDNQDAKVLPPRKQDVALLQKQGGQDFSGRVPVNAPFHVSLYSFRASHDLTLGEKDCFGCSPASLSSPNLLAHGTKSVGTAMAMTDSNSVERRRSLRRQNTDYEREVPQEYALRADLASADWMWVFGSPGRTGEKSLVPTVFAAVRLKALADGTLLQAPTDPLAGSTSVSQWRQ